MRAPHVLLVYERPPMDWMGTPVVLWRHLTRFERDGWRVSFCTYEHKVPGAPGVPETWVSVPIPRRRWWWPPQREWFPGVAALRRRLYGADVARQLRSDPPDVVLTVLEPYEGEIAVDIARRLNRPLAVILHDQPELWQHVADDPVEQKRVRRSVDKVLARADRVYPVTPALAAAYGPDVLARAQTLLPIPAGAGRAPVAWRDAYTTPHIVHVGSLHTFQWPNLVAVADALAPVGGRLTIVSTNNADMADALAKQYSNVCVLPSFPTSDEMLEFCAAEASAMLVSYSFEKQAGSRTSFPSRLVELTHLGLPVLLLAPPYAAASAWARSAGWTSYVDALDVDLLRAETLALATRDGWERRAAESRHAAEADFDPARIHAGFDSDLRLLTGTD